MIDGVFVIFGFGVVIGALLGAATTHAVITLQEMWRTR